MRPIKPTVTALVTLITLQIVMLLAMLFQAPPHPPYITPLFGIGPMLGVSLAIAFGAILHGAEETRAGSLFSAGACVFAMVSYGPQKWFDPAFPQIWPAVIAAQIATLVIAYGLFQSARSSARLQQG
ncbi:MAG: hypothetical protein AAGG69_06945 [Pseudomonadota bacterium]